MKAILDRYAAAAQHVFFVQVGSNDMFKHDILHIYVEQYGWCGILTEPVPYVFARLVERYGDIPSLHLEECAVASHGGVTDFYYLREDDDARLPPWYDQIGSLSRQHLLNHAVAIPDVEDRIVHDQTIAVTFADLCAKHGREHVAVIQIDVEGADLDVLRSIDLTAVRPDIVIYEHQHLDDADGRAAKALLMARGFHVIDDENDSVAIAPAVLLALLTGARTFDAGRAGQR